MYIKILLITALILSTNASADTWYNALQGICDVENKNFKVQYIGKYNEEGEAMVKDVKSKTQDTCTIDDNKYELESRFYRNAPAQRVRCGGHEYVDIKILKNGKSIFKSKVLEDCHYSSNFISSVTITNDDKIIVERELGKPSHY